MVTVLLDRVYAKKIEDVCKKNGLPFKEIDPAVINSKDEFYIIDYTHTYGMGIAKKIRLENPASKMIIFFPTVRSYVKSEIEKIGAIPMESPFFFSNLKDILKGKTAVQKN